MFRRIYLDHSATTAVAPEVLEAMMPYLTNKFGNASSIHNFGQETRSAVDKARHQIAALINARPSEVIFTSGGTEANNLAIRGLIESRFPTSHGRQDGTAAPPHIITSAIEHPAVKNVCEGLEKSGVNVNYLPVYGDGVVRLADLEAAITDETVLISIMAANNEIGTIQPIEGIGRIVKARRESGQKIYFHTDAVQAAGKIPVNVAEIGCDLLSLSAHKMYAPKGVGCLYVRRGTRLSPQSLGGRQERGIRGGTEPVALIAAFGKAGEMAATDLDKNAVHLRTLRDMFENAVLETIPDTTVNGDPTHRLPSISNISFAGIEGEALLINLDMQGIAVSTGSACSSGSLEPSPVIRALGHGDAKARGAIRFSFGMGNTSEEIGAVLDALAKAVANLRQLLTGKIRADRDPPGRR